MTMARIPISKFKIDCQAIIERVALTGETVTITRSGKAIAEIVPITTHDRRSPQSRDIPGTIDLDEDLLDMDDSDATLRAWDDLNSAIERDVGAGSANKRTKRRKP